MGVERHQRHQLLAKLLFLRIVTGMRAEGRVEADRGKARRVDRIDQRAEGRLRRRRDQAQGAQARQPPAGIDAGRTVGIGGHRAGFIDQPRSGRLAGAERGPQAVGGRDRFTRG